MPSSLVRYGRRWRRQADGVLRLHGADVERRHKDQDQGAKVERIGLRWRDRQLQKGLAVGWLFAVVFHVVFLRETGREGKRKTCNHASGRGGWLGTRNRASSANRLSADDTIRTRL